MNDMAEVIAPKSDQINAEDLIAGPITIKITGVQIRGGEEQPVSVTFEGSKKFWRPCKTTARIMVAAWGADSKEFVGKSLTLFRDPNVKWAGLAAGGIRISHMSHIDKDFTIALAESKQKRVPTVIKKLAMGAAPKADPNAAFAQDEGRTAARKGKTAFTAWWNSDDGKKARAACQPIMAELQRIVAEADAPKPEPDTDPFGLPPIADPIPTQSELDAAMAEAERAAHEPTT